MLKKALLKKLSKKLSPSRGPISFDRANTVGIIGIYEERNALDQLQKEFEQLGKKPRVISLITQPEKNKEYPAHTFTKKDVTIMGSIQSDELLYFTKQKYDFLLCLDHTGNPIIKYLLSKTEAQHRIGFHHSEFEDMLDMMILLGEDDSPSEEILKYVKMIRHND